ncbi:MAG: hypothetical protein H0V89_13090 [Deltaproteobacteria bacterium]|nr:hypothetical protein [Deltaproteobacteria bacterium]
MSEIDPEDPGEAAEAEDTVLARRLVDEPAWQWMPGMRTLGGDRLVEGRMAATDALPDLGDWPTVGALLGIIAGYRAFTDLIHGPEGWIVAVEIDGDVTGYAADTPGEAAAWALLAVLENLSGEIGIA